jgi:hypothetical protein
VSLRVTHIVLPPPSHTHTTTTTTHPAVCEDERRCAPCCDVCARMLQEWM